jgi:hypothetical protein
MSDSWKTRRNQKTSLFSYEFDRLRKSCTKCLFCALYVLHLSYFIFRLYTIHIKNIIKCPFLKNMSLSLIFCRKAHVGCFRCLLCARHSFGPKLLTSSDIIFFSYVMRTQVRGLDHFWGFADEYKPMMPKAQ